MRSRHLCQVDGLPIFVYGAHCTIALVVSEAVFDADDDPAQCMLAYITLT